jgi:peptidoglycan/xylan/chitin deacetylase (PgdA/CDA1 family)
MRCAAFTVDVDRDVNLAERGRYDAVSQAHGSYDSSPRFSSSARGLRLMVDLLDEMGIKGTFFLEGDTLRAIARSLDVRSMLAGHEVASHGICHEDLTGEGTGICLTGPQVAQVIEDGANIIEDMCGRRPQGFRAPYQHIDGTALGMLAESEFIYDSSLTVPMTEGRIAPWRLDSGLLEIPIASGQDERGKKIVSYLWPMHEGKRVPADYIHLASEVRSGALVLATHSWHIAETYGKGILDQTDTAKGLASLRKVLEGIMDMGMRFIALEDLARTWEE